MIFTREQPVSLIYQFWIHTERIDASCRRWFEFVFNTPSHHRVHHGSNEQYLDRNYGGILIIWDRLFGTFEPEGERVALRADQEHRDLQPGPRRLPRVRGDRAATCAAPARWRERLGYMFRGPGWSPGTRERRGTVTRRLRVAPASFARSEST